MPNALGVAGNVRANFYDSATFRVGGYAHIGYFLTEADRAAGDQIVELIKDTEGPVLSEEAGFTMAAGRDVVTNPTQLRNLDLAGRFVGDQLVAMIERQEFGLVILRALILSARRPRSDRPLLFASRYDTHERIRLPDPLSRANPEQTRERAVVTAYSSHSSFTEHDFPRHPEHAGRIKAVWEQLSRQGLLDQVEQIAPAPVSDEQILAAHSRSHLDRLVSVSRGDRVTRLDHDTYALPVSLRVARLAAGAAISAVDSVMTGHCRQRARDRQAARPPCHRLEWQMGFCLLNNIAIAARHAQARHSCGKVLIIDYDVHHGNGTQDIFYADPTVLFISTHQSPFYPGTGALGETGTAAGAGNTLNVPIAGGHGDASYERIFAEVVWPAAERFAPDLLLVSAGFDAHWVDPLAQMQLSLAGLRSSGARMLAHGGGDSAAAK